MIQRISTATTFHSHVQTQTARNRRCIHEERSRQMRRKTYQSRPHQPPCLPPCCKRGGVCQIFFVNLPLPLLSAAALWREEMAYQRKDIAVHAHQSRFALLSVDSDSDDGEEQLELSQVAVLVLCTCVLRSRIT